MAETRSDIFFDIIWNDGREETMIQLINLKLPKMPKEYIVRLVFDRNHRSICIFRKAEKMPKLIGSICFRPFYRQNFTEIVFCAITSKEQVKGFGKRIMNQLKEYMKRENIFNFLTFADNHAIGYFKKQGFTKVANLANSEWAGFIKEYDGGTLMECKLQPEVNYVYLKEILALQKVYALGEIRKISSCHVVHAGIKPLRRKRGVPKETEERSLSELQKRYKRIPGLVDAGWNPSKDLEDDDLESGSTAMLCAKIGSVVKEIKNFKDSWPFLNPVDVKEVPDYYSIIKEPMDLSEVARKLNSKEYGNVQEFERDMELIFENCKEYNNRDTTYYRCAENVQRLFKKAMMNVF